MAGNSRRGGVRPNDSLRLFCTEASPPPAALPCGRATAPWRLSGSWRQSRRWLLGGCHGAVRTGPGGREAGRRGVCLRPPGLLPPPSPRRSTHCAGLSHAEANTGPQGGPHSHPWITGVGRELPWLSCRVPWISTCPNPGNSEAGRSRDVILCFTKLPALVLSDAHLEQEEAATDWTSPQLLRTVHSSTQYQYIYYINFLKMKAPTS